MLSDTMEGLRPALCHMLSVMIRNYGVVFDAQVC